MRIMIPMSERTTNPFRFTGPVDRVELIDRDSEAEQLQENARGGHLTRLEAPRRYGKTSLLRRVLAEAASEGMATAMVDFEDVLSLGAIVTRIERGYGASLGGSMRRWVNRHVESWQLGLSLGPVGFGMTLRTNPAMSVEPALLRLLSLPEAIRAKHGVRTLIVFDEVQGLLRVDGAAGIVRSVVQHHYDDASYVFAGSAPSLMSRLFDDPDAPFLSQGVPLRLPPLSAEALSDDVEARFRSTGRDPGEALDELVRFSRGHPQRSMLLAHHLWSRIPRADRGDLDDWLDARDTAVEQQDAFLRAQLNGLPLNEQRAAAALALNPGAATSQEALNLVGLSRNSAYGAVTALRDRGEVIETPLGLRLTDPLMEHWLRERKEL